MKLFLAISLLLISFASANTAAQTQTKPQGKTKWTYLHLSTGSGTDKFGPLTNGGQQWKTEVPRKIPVLIITEPFEIPDNGWDPCMQGDLVTQFASHLLAKHRAALMKLQFHRTLPIQTGLYFPDRPANVRDYESWKSQKGRTVAGVPFEVVVIKDFKFKTMDKYPCSRNIPIAKELENIIGNGIL